MIHSDTETTRGRSTDAPPAAGAPDGRFLAADPRMLELRDLARRGAATAAPVLATGESGVGKEVLARFIHAESERAAGPFVKINCAAIPHDLLESELFGHERGAFTGASQRRDGKFAQAHRGTLLLDEIGDMSLPLQAKLLHVLEDFSFTRVGGTRPVRIDARIVATTNKHLEQAVERGEFRADLYFRLKVIRLHIPPLRERRADIPLLSRHFVQRFSGADGADRGLPDRLLEAFLRYRWPGNVRELKHLIQRFLIFPDVDSVLAEVSAPDATTRVGDADAFPSTSATLQGILDGLGRPGHKIPLKSIAAAAAERAERGVVLAVLEKTGGNRKAAAAHLDVCYKTLLKKLHAWELDCDGPGPAWGGDGGPGDFVRDLTAVPPGAPPPPGPRPAPARRGRHWSLPGSRRSSPAFPSGPPRRLSSS